jgi:hypothetical protein
MRYVLHFNPHASDLLDSDYIQLERLDKNLKSGATVRVRGLDTPVEGTIPFTPREKGSTRFGSVINEKKAREVGIKGRQRYILETSEKLGWYYLVPHSRVGKKARKLDVPAVSISIFDRA